MSIVRCNHCNKNIDTDFDAEHFIPDTEHCLIQVEEAAPDLLKAVESTQAFFDNMPKGQFGGIVCDVGLMNDMFINLSKGLKKAINN